MTTFSFSTGNPTNLTGGATASMTDLSGSFADLKTFLNGGSITDTNITAGGLTDTSLASPTNAAWRTVINSTMSVASITTSKFWQGGTLMIASGSTGGAAQGIWNPPSAADVAIGSKATRLRLRVPYVINGVLPGVDVIWGLYPITNTSGAASNAIGLTLGTVITGSEATATSPTVNGTATGASFDFSLVTGANAYVIGVRGSGSQAATSLLMGQAILEMRHT